MKAMQNATKQRILLISARSDLGGGPKQLAETLGGLSGEFDFYVAAPAEGEFATHFKNSAVKFCEIPHRKAGLTSLLKVLSFVREEQIQIIHTHGFGAGVFSFLPALFGIKVVHTFHGLHFQSSLRGRVKTFLESFFSMLRKKHICVSPSEKFKAHTLGIDSVVIPNGIALAETTNTKQNLNWPPRIAGVLSRLDVFKNVAWLIENYQLIQSRYPELQLLIAGHGEEESNLKALTSKLHLDNLISFVGPQKSADFFQRIDLLLCPSKGEGLPYTVLEAMSFGLPVLASNVPGHCDLLPSECLFSLVKPDFTQSTPHVAITRNQRLIKTQFILEQNLNLLGKLYRDL